MKLFKFIRYAGVVLAALAVVGCASTPSHDYDTSVNFSALKTYSWLESKALEDEDPRISSTLFNDRVVAAVDRELAARGYVKTDGDSDFKVIYHMTIDTKTREDRVHWGYSPFGWGWSHRRFPHTHVESRVREFDEGTLIIDIVDSTGKKLWWRADVSKAVRKSYGPQQATERINQSVAIILSQFPPQ